MPSPDDPVARAALEEIVEIYRSTDPDQAEKPLSGADVVDELGVWIERNHKLLRKLGLVDDPLGQEGTIAEVSTGVSGGFWIAQIVWQARLAKSAHLSTYQVLLSSFHAGELNTYVTPDR